MYGKKIPDSTLLRNINIDEEDLELDITNNNNYPIEKNYYHDDALLGSALFQEAEQAFYSDFQIFDLNRSELRILLLLMTRDALTAGQIAGYLSLPRSEAYNYLNNLVKLGVVFVTHSKPRQYHSLPIDQTIEYLVETKKNELNRIGKKREEYQSIIGRLRSGYDPRKVCEMGIQQHFQTLSGMDAITTKIKKLCDKARNKIELIVDEKYIFHLHHSGLIEHLISLTEKGILVELFTPNYGTREFMDDLNNTKNINGSGNNNGSLSVKKAKTAPTSMIIIDDQEVLLLGGGSFEKARKFMRNNASGFYTNDPQLVSVFKYLKDDLAGSK